MVRVTGLEPAHLSVLEPKSNVSANFTTPAYSIFLSDQTADRDSFINQRRISNESANSPHQQNESYNPAHSTEL